MAKLKKKFKEQKQSTIIIKRDQSCSMAAVSLNGVIIMEGNFRDFHPGCHGITKYGEFNSPSDLAINVTRYLRRKGDTKIETIQETYKYEY